MIFGSDDGFSYPQSTLDSWEKEVKRLEAKIKRIEDHCMVLEKTIDRLIEENEKLSRVCYNS